jgi:hypothetical protein
MQPYMNCHDNTGCAWQDESYTLTEMTPAEAEADCQARGGKVQKSQAEVERCEVVADGTGELTFQRGNTNYCGPLLLHRALSMRDFIAYEYEQGNNGHAYSKNPRLIHNAEQNQPARIPVAVLFRKVTP